MTEAKVSVIVPVYNTEEYLERCLRSLLRQSLREIEIIAIDDGSTDRSRQILDKYAARYPEKIRLLSQPNSGQAVARNRGLAHCRGTYVGFLDSDDYADPDMFRKLYEAALREGADYVACGYADTAERDGRRIVLSRYVSSRTAHTPKELFIDALVPPYIHLYRRQVLKEAKARFTEGAIYEDIAFYMQVIPYIHVLAEVPEALVFRLRREGSTMATISPERVRQIFPVLLHVLSFYRENGFYEEFREGVDYMCVRILACSSLRRVSQVSGRRERAALIGETLAFIERWFPDFRRNRLVRKGVRHLYLRTFCRFTANLYVFFHRLLGDR